ncbi:MAG: hypothetical protein R2857_07250 [Vampirovibrionales bacterium]
MSKRGPRRIRTAFLLGLREDVNNYTRIRFKSVNQNHQTIDTLID